MISFKQLHYALAVEQHLHFRKAAEACSVSQPAMSSALSELERNLGVALFERSNRQVLVTEFGRQFLAKARDVELSVNELEMLPKRHTRVLSSRMSVGFIPTACPYLLPHLMPALAQRYPKFEMGIVEEHSKVLVDKVRAGEIDTAVVALPCDTLDLLTFELCKDRFYWVTHNTETPVELSEILAKNIPASRLMLLKDDHCLKQQVLNVLGISRSQIQALEAISLTTLIQLVEGQVGTTIVPEIALNQLANEQLSIHAIPLADNDAHRRIAFVVRPAYPHLNSVEALIHLIRNALNASLKE
ncbi:MAG: LysR family transcriptional regulator [Arenicella sp.]|nr:LysR family transcriptional regulator [Arenicella sp.]